MSGSTKIVYGGSLVNSANPLPVSIKAINDNVKLNFGTDSDFSIAFDGTSLVFYFGSTRIAKLSSGGELSIKADIQTNATI